MEIREHAHACIGSKAVTHMYSHESPFWHCAAKGESGDAECARRATCEFFGSERE